MSTSAKGYDMPAKGYDMPANGYYNSDLTLLWESGLVVGILLM
jgi:hypothetical protein